DLPSLGALLEHPEVDTLHLRSPRVQAIGPVERQQRHTVLDLPLHHFAHVDSSHSSLITPASLLGNLGGHRGNLGGHRDPIRLAAARGGGTFPLSGGPGGLSS